MAYRWFVIHAYSGFERKVADKIQDDATRLGLSDQIESVFFFHLQLAELGSLQITIQ